MNENIAKNQSQLLDSEIPETDPFSLFESWFAEAKVSEINDPNAMALATSTDVGVPSVRMVLQGTWPEVLLSIPILKSQGPRDCSEPESIDSFPLEESAKTKFELKECLPKCLLRWLTRIFTPGLLSVR